MEFNDLDLKWRFFIIIGLIASLIVVVLVILICIMFCTDIIPIDLHNDISEINLDRYNNLFDPDSEKEEKDKDKSKSV